MASHLLPVAAGQMRDSGIPRVQKRTRAAKNPRLDRLARGKRAAGSAPLRRPFAGWYSRAPDQADGKPGARVVFLLLPGLRGVNARIHEDHLEGPRGPDPE